MFSTCHLIFTGIICSIKITGFKIPSSDIKSGTAGLTVEASGISVSASADWSYREHSW